MNAATEDEYMLVSLPRDEEEPEHPELEPYNGPVVEASDPRLTEEILADDPEGDAYAPYRVMRFKKASDGSPYSASVEPS